MAKGNGETQKKPHPAISTHDCNSFYSPVNHSTQTCKSFTHKWHNKTANSHGKREKPTSASIKF